MLRLSKLSSVGLCGLMFCTLLASGCMKPMRYDPSQLARFDARAVNLRLEFETKKGRQVAFYIPSLNSPRKAPARINILYPGIASVALDWQRLIPLEKYPDAGYLLIDYPGRGLSTGGVFPVGNDRNTQGALKALAAHFGSAELDAGLSLMGHSFGAGTALRFAAGVKVERIVLIAPFNTLKSAVALKSYILSIIIPVHIDNRKLIHKILAADKPPKISILHGGRDKSLPVRMGRELASIAPDQIDYYEFGEDSHVDILEKRREMIFRILNGRND